MTSLPTDTSFRVGSLGSTASSFKDAIASYRRSQYFLTTSNVASSTENLNETAEDVEAVIGEDARNQGPSVPSLYGSSGFQDGLVGNLEWDEDELPTPRPVTDQNVSGGNLLPPAVLSPAARDGIPVRTQRRAGERTPLLRKATSLSSASGLASRGSGALRPVGQPSSLTAPESQQSIDGTLTRRVSTVSLKSTKYNFGGKSTFGQTLFNSIAILLGIGMLSEPLAFAYAGWIGSSFLIIFYGYITCYTAKILAHIILDDPRLRSYADIGRKAFGPKSMPLTSAMFCLELFAVSVALVTLYADSLHSVVPSYSTDTYKIVGLLVLIPTVFLPLSLLSYTSILGIVSTLFLVAVIFIDGFSKKNSPGSLWQPAETNVGIHSTGELGIAFGLFMAGFSGHAVIPSLARDMVDPGQFDVMIDWAFFTATFIYSVIGVAGYLMFGYSVHDEISQDLLLTKGYNPFLNKIALWMLVINPLSKFALATRPLNVTLEIMLGLETTLSPASSESHDTKLSTSSEITRAGNNRHILRRVFIVIERVGLTLLSVTVSILVPQFSSVMAFLGSFSAFLLCVVGPVSAKVALQGKCGLWDGLLLATGVVMAMWGTGAAFWSATE
ncbi:hypothetical protein NEOLEDRAFT_1173781 [Neolentinus lepideus HHB14362 ss-1]|uniref:Amino acid transporter transmembrane domain-containing protein n=1 Tax=Neolentinus lepideus HHB14362 ss-1 TaxID=1314782 RepID=A0A165VXE2_9AGAM|nr:hypothetical protein NEOLEDRAFT_1173781 [Neolentinus lepideus HHB14362 ss-1]